LKTNGLLAGLIPLLFDEICDYFLGSKNSGSNLIGSTCVILYSNHIIFDSN